MAEADKTGSGRFGTCCDALNEAMAGKDFESLVSEGRDGVLYLAVGLIELDDSEPGIVDHPMYFCPFCGTRLQTEEEVQAKAEEEPEDEE